LLGLVPAAQRERADVGDLAFQVEHDARHSGLAAPPGSFESTVEQVVAGQGHHRRCVFDERRFLVAGPGADVGEEPAHVDQPGVRGRRVLTFAAAALHRAGVLEGVADEPARLRRCDLCAGDDVGVGVA
jgi:hypothetical protein